jgi:hypothetical protein
MKKNNWVHPKKLGEYTKILSFWVLGWMLGATLNTQPKTQKKMGSNVW